MSEQNKALARRWFEEVWNQGRESTIDQLFHPQGKAYGFPEPDSVLIGPEGFKTIHRVFHNEDDPAAPIQLARNKLPYRTRP
jgi:hypothetical protein